MMLESSDFDGDGTGDNADTDDDDDGVLDTNDVFPIDATESLDFDNDGTGDNADTDDDDDGVLDTVDAFPLIATESLTLIVMVQEIMQIRMMMIDDNDAFPNDAEDDFERWMMT